MATGKRIVRPRNLGNSVWLDGILDPSDPTGQDVDFFRRFEISGVRFNLTRFERGLLAGTKTPAHKSYADLLIESVRQSANLLMPVYEATRGGDGFVAVPLPAVLSYDVESLIEEGMLFYGRAACKNVMALLPATAEGIAAIQELTAAGVNAGVYGLFSVRRYREALDSYLAGVEQRRERNQDIRTLGSIAEFSLGRLDSLSGEPLDSSPSNTVGGLATAVARSAYGYYISSVLSSRFQELASHGLRAQRLAWSAEGATSRLLRAFPDHVMGPATVCELPADSIRQLNSRSISGQGISNGLREAQAATAHYERHDPDLERRRTSALENMICAQVLSTDRALARTDERRGRPATAPGSARSRPSGSTSLR